MGTILPGLWAIWLGLAPVSWLPGVAPSILYQIKLAMVVVLMAVTWWWAVLQRKFSLPAGLAGIGGLLALLAAASFGFAQAETDVVVRHVAEVVISFCVLWSMFLLGREPRIGLTVLWRASLIVSVFSLLVVSYSIFGIPNWRAPIDYYYNDLTVAGFEAKRTGWSNGIALYGMLVLLLPFTVRVKSTLVALVAITLAGAVIASQFIVGGRGGLLASVLMGVSAAWVLLPRRWFVVVAAIGLGLIVGSGLELNEDVASHLRADRLKEGGDLYSRFNHFSAGRLSGYLSAIDQIFERPIFGRGFGSEDALYRGLEIHNLWLRLAMEGGVLLPLTLFFVVLRIVVGNPRRWARRTSNAANAKSNLPPSDLEPANKLLFIALLGGLIMTLVEPRMLVGALHNSAVWWAAAGVLLAVRSSREPTSWQ